MRAVGLVLREVVKGAMLLGGLALATYGFHLAWEPLGFIVPGTLLLTAGVLVEMR